MTPTPVDRPRPAATLILLRDGAHGVEVLMLKRHGLSDAFGEAFVFPGGKVDAADAALGTSPDAIDEAPAALHARLGETEVDAAGAAGLFVAAIREAAEEADVLIGQGAEPQATSAALAALREGAPFATALASTRVRLLASALHPWARWITPVGRLQPKRFDARFFVAREPPDAVARHDGRETTEAAWLRPRDALERYWARDIALAPPQIMTLAHFTRLGDVDGILAEARRRTPLHVQPHVLDEPAGMTLCLPGDPDHPVSTRAMPGPLRLAVRSARFEPEGGFDAFFQ